MERPGFAIETAPPSEATEPLPLNGGEAVRLRPLYHICVVDYFLRRAFLVLALAAFNSTVAYAETTPTNNFFHAASAEFGVPEEILQAVAFAQTRGVEPPTESDGDLPHVPRFGIMGLREPQVIVAATRLHVLPDRVKEDRSVNIRAAAALLREYAGSDAGSAPENWAGALAQLSGIDDPEIADVFVFAALSAIDRGIVEPNIT